MKKTIYFDKYIPYTYAKKEDGAETENRLSLIELFRRIQATPSSNSFHELYGEKYRTQVCRYHEKEKIWELQILHLRNTLLPGIADEKSEFEPMILPEGRYLTEWCTVLYSETNHVIYLQRNIACMSSKRLCYYLKAMLPLDTKILLKPVISGRRIDKITENAGFRKVVLACSLDSKKDPDPTNRLGKLLQNFGTYQGAIANITLGMGRKKGKLNSREIRALLEEAYNEGDVRTLKVQVDSVGAGVYEWIDLMLDRETCFVNVEYSREAPITHAQLFDACLEKIIEKQKE